MPQANGNLSGNAANDGRIRSERFPKRDRTGR